MTDTTTRAAATTHSWPVSLLLFTVATAGEFVALVGWFRLHTGGHWAIAAAVLLAGFVVERYCVVHWLHLPSIIRTPFGREEPLWLVIGGTTVAEVIVWAGSITLAQSEAFAAGLIALVVGIHVVHSYEVAVIQHRAFGPVFKDWRHTLVLTLCEIAGGLLGFVSVSAGHGQRGAWILLGSLLVEHLLQVSALKKQEDALNHSGSPAAGR